MTRKTKPTLALIRLGLNEQLAEDFEQAVRHHAMMKERDRTKPHSPQQSREFSRRIRENKAEALTIVYQCWPGVGKTKAVTEIAESFGTDFPTLVFGLSHKSFNNVHRKGWLHWKGHASTSRGDSETCSSSILYEKGYRPSREYCDCGHDVKRETGHPTFAVTEYVLSDSFEGKPLASEVFHYGLWVFDEIDFNKFVGKMVVTAHDLKRSAQGHPLKYIRFLSDVLLDVMAQHTEANKDVKDYGKMEHWSGAELYERFEAAWISRLGKGSLINYMYVFHHLKDLHLEEHSYELWDKWTTIESAPINFAPKMSNILWNELNHYLEGNSFNPQLHLVWERPKEGQPVQSLYRIRWRKYIPVNAPPILILDASAAPELLKQVFYDVDEVHQTPELDFPSNVNVYQLY